MRSIATGGVRFIWKDSESGTRGLGSHTGLKSNEERNARIWLLNNENGLYPEEAAEQLLTSYAEELGYTPNIDTSDALSEILDVVSSYATPSSMFEAAQVRHAEINEQNIEQEAEDAQARVLMPIAESLGLSLDEYLAWEEMMLAETLPAFEADYEQITAIFVEAAQQEEILNQNNDERSTENADVQSGVHSEGRLSDGSQAGVGVLQGEQMDNGIADSRGAEAGQGSDAQVVEPSTNDIPASEVSAGAEKVDNGYNGRSLTTDEAKAVVNAMQQNAIVVELLDLTPENWIAQFGEDGIIDTPIGNVKMGENQYFKLAQKGREGKLGMIKPTLQSPDIIVEEKSSAKNGQTAERNSSYVFVKAFTNTDGSRNYIFTSVTIRKDGKEVVISNQEKETPRIERLLKEGKLAYISEATLPSESTNSTQGNQSTILGGAILSESKDTTSEPQKQEIDEKNVATEQEADISDEDIEALWIKSRDELWRPNDEIATILNDKLYEAHPEEHQPADRKKVVRHLIEAAEKYKDHPIAKEVLKYVKYPKTISMRVSPLTNREEMRRKPLRARAKMWEAKVGVPVHLIETFEEVPTEDARKAILDGKAVTAWVTDGEVYLYMPYLRNRTEVDKTYIHEVVAHVGMKRLLGKEGYRQFCMRVYNEVMTEADRDFYDAYPNVKNHAQAADEYIAHLSEDTDMESSVWQKVVRIFRDALRVLGIETALTNKDIQDLLRDSYKNLINEENVEKIVDTIEDALGEANTQFRITPEEDARYLQLVEEGNLEEAQKMVNAVANASGYNNDESWKKAHTAPRKSEDNVNPFNTEELVPDDYWTHPEWYTNIRNSADDRESYYNMVSAINKYKRLVAEGNQDDADKVTVKMYRGVDKTANAKESTFRNGDWITPSRSYAKWSAPEGRSRVIEQEVPLKNIWWDGNSINEWGYDDGENYVYKDTKNNRKLVDAVTYDDNGNVIPLSKRFNSRNADVRFRVVEPAPTFYSNAERAAENVKQEKATPEQWLKMIEKNGGLKAGEDKWLGLSDWLKSSDKKTLTKQEVLDFIKENQIQIEEVVYGDIEDNPKFKELEKEYQSYYAETYDSDVAFQRMVDKYGEEFDVAFNGSGMNLYPRNEYGSEDAQKYLGVNEINSTRRQYTTDGLDNKREIALTVPTIEGWNESDEIHFGDAGNGRAIAWVRFGETTDADGNRVLIIDEVQSKRHQEGREKGYAKTEANDAFVAYRDQMMDKYGIEDIGSIYGVLNTEDKIEFDKLRTAANVEFRNSSDIPSAPFEKNWAELAMKRMLRYAAENGFDKVAWTTGDQQAERYDISKSVDNIKSEDNNVEETADGTLIVKNITIYAGGSVHNLFVDANGIVRWREYDGKKLSDIVGKPLAEKLMEQGDFELEGDGLRIGGEGMKAFYDQMIPSFMNKYGKKWGVKVGEVTMPSLEENNTMHSIDVTDAMRESVMQGQPMFRISDYDRQFADLQSEYDALDKDDVEALNEWREKKRNILQSYMGSKVDELNLPVKDVYVYDGTNDEQIENIYDAYVKALDLAAEGRREDFFVTPPIEQFMSLLSERDALYLRDADIAVFNANAIDNNEANVYETMLHEQTHGVVARIIPDNTLSSIWEDAKKNSPDAAKVIASAYIGRINRGDEFLTYYTSHRLLFSQRNRARTEAYIKGEGNISADELINSTQDLLPLTNDTAKQILNFYRDEYRKKLGDGFRRERNGDEQAAQGHLGEGIRSRGAGNTRREIISAATDLAASLGVKLNVVDAIPNASKGVKGRYSISTDQVYFVLPNATSVEDAVQTVLHEVVAHKGLRDVVGRDHFEEFLGKVFRAADTNTSRKIVALAARNGWDFNVATEEYLASLAEQGFDSRENRTFLQKVRDLFMDMFRAAKIALGFNINDNDMRYMLWRTYQMQRSNGIMAVAEDVVMQRKLGVGNFRNRSITEREQIIADAKTNGTYLKAPNGKDTNLTPEQWVTVRTDAFKKWFGDWEKTARIEKLRNSDSIKISADDYSGYELNRANAKEWLKQNVRGEYINADTGERIAVSNVGINEVTSHGSQSEEHLKSLSAIPRMIEGAIFIDELPNRKDNDKYDSYRYYVCGLNIDGVDYTAKMVVGVKGDSKYYDHRLTEIEKGSLIDNLNSLSNAVAENSNSPVSVSKDTKLIELLQTNSSKVVDANGEPKVVYNGSKVQHYNYDGRLRTKGQSATNSKVSFFTDNKNVAERYGKFVNKVFLNIRNPYEIDYNGAGWQGWSGAADGMQRASTDSYADLLANGSVDSTLERIIENYGRAEADYLASGSVRNEGIAPDGVIAYEVADPMRSTLYIVRNAEAKDISRNSVTPKGVETFTNLGKSSLLFDSQIKSATDNVGTFDPSNDDIRYRVAPSTPSTGEARQLYDDAVRSYTKKNNVKKTENLWHYLREAYQDSMLSVKKLMDAVLAETGNKLREADDVYRAENQLSSKNKAEIEKWERDFMKPLQLEILDLVKKGASYEDIVEYLLAKHGLERNLEFSRRDAEEDGKVWDGFVKRDFSGLTELTGEAEHFTEAAQQIVEEFEGKYNTDNLWSKINAATKESLKKSYDSGLMSKETYDKVANMFQYYIPLRGWDNNVAADQYEYMANKGMKILPALKTAKGRTSRADDPIATLGSVGESSIIQGNRNLMKQKFLNFAQNNPTSLLTVDEQWYEQNADGTWKPSNPKIPTDATADEVDAIIKAHEAKMEALGDKATKKRQGLNINLHTTKWEEEEHAVNVKRNGKEYKIFVNGNPIAAQAINGFTNPNANKKDSWEWIEQRATAVKNFMARAFTSMNPAFIFTNLARDLVWAGTSVAIKENATYTRLYSKNISKAMTTAQLPRLVSKWKKGTLDMSNPIEKYFHEFVTNGGETGFTQLNTVDDYKRNMERFIKEAQGGVTTKAKKGWRWIWDNVEFLNRSAEDTTRFMVYLTSRQMGRPISESIANAKDITVNFNKKGRGTMGANVLGFAYIFFNATIQSLANFGKLIANHPKKTAAALTTFGASGMIAPMTALALQAMLSGDDDEPTYWDLPEWVRRNNIVLYVGGSGYITIPLPHELRPFYGMGELALSVLMGKEEPDDALKKAVAGFASLMPLDFTGNGGNVAVNFTPTIAQPVAQLIANKDYFGVPIYRRTDYNKLNPGWTKAYKSTNRLLVDATEWLNEATGGDKYKRGIININPAIVEHLFEGYFGGMAKTINRTAKTFSMLWDEDAREWRNVPILSSFYQKSDDRTSGSQVNREYFDAADEADAIEYLYSGYNKEAKMGSIEYAEKLNELINSDVFKRYQKVNSYKEAIAKMNTVLKEADPADREDIETRIMELKVDMLEELEQLNNR